MIIMDPTPALQGQLWLIIHALIAMKKKEKEAINNKKDMKTMMKANKCGGENSVFDEVFF